MMHEGHGELPADRPIAELFADLGQQLTTLIRQEWALARTEIGQKGARLGRELAFIALGGAVSYAGFLAILSAIIIALARLGMAWWLAALLVGLVVAAAGSALILMGISALRAEDLTPRQTVDTLRQDARVLKRGIS